MKRLLTLFVVVLCTITPGVAFDITTPAVIGDNMVVQRNSEANIWGWDKAGGKVAIVADWSVADTVRVTCDHNSRFEAKIPTPEAGGPYTIQIIGSGKTKVIENVMVGEVWLCGGQSNMQMSLSSTWGTKVDYHKYFSTLDNPNIRTFFVPLIASDYPQNDCKGVWNECHAEIMNDVSLAAYFFAERLQAELGMAVGIVMSAWGGTNAETWMSEAAAESNADVAKSAAYMDPKTWKPIKTSSLYNAMLSPIIPFKFSGALWYQGESNIPCYQYYDSVMRTLIDCWREEFGEDLPFYFAQIAPYVYKGTSLNRSPYLREQQYLTSKYDNCEMIVVNDLVHDVKNIHPKDKKSVGYRFADMALSRIYGVEGVDVCYPEVDGVETKGDKIIVTLKGCDGGVVAQDGETSGFKIAAEGGEFVDATAKIKSNVITLSAKGVKSPKYVRYLFDDSSTCAIKGVNGLPMLPYRNDTFTLAE